MLVGVGGSGKQSLARLAAYICGCEVFQIAVTSTYGVNDFKEALLGLYTKVGSGASSLAGTSTCASVHFVHTAWLHAVLHLLVWPLQAQPLHLHLEPPSHGPIVRRPAPRGCPPCSS